MVEEKGWRVVQLKDILPDNAIDEVVEYLKREDATPEGLKAILRKYEHILLKRGVLPDYLAYYLWSVKKKLEEVV